MTDLQSLIDRLEEATGPDRQLDGEIFQFFGRTRWKDALHNARALAPKTSTECEVIIRAKTKAPAFTASIDVALTLYKDENEALYALGDAIETVFNDFDIAPTTTSWKWHVLKRFIITALRARQEEG